MSNPTRCISVSGLSVSLIVALAACGDNAGGSADAGPAAPDAAVDAAPPPPPSLRFYDHALAIDVSPDGRLALFGDLSTADGHLYLLDTVTGEMTQPVDVGDPTRDFATGISDTGRISALHGDPVQAGLWTAAGGWLDLASPYPAGCDQDLAGAWDVSADGHVAVGLLWHGCVVEGFRWSDQTGTGVMMPLELVGAAQGGGPNGPNNRATVISDDGAIAAGWASTDLVDRAPARWTADGAGELLPRVADDMPGEVLSISADGAVLAGIEGADAVVWTSAGRTPVPRLDVVLPGDPVFPNAMTADGAVVFGGQGSAFFGIPTAFVWTAAAGARPLADLVTAAGLQLPASMVLTSVLGASADGTVLAGTAFDVDTSVSHTFALRLPASAL